MPKQQFWPTSQVLLKSKIIGLITSVTFDTPHVQRFDHEHHMQSIKLISNSLSHMTQPTQNFDFN